MKNILMLKAQVNLDKAGTFLTDGATTQNTALTRKKKVN